MRKVGFTLCYLLFTVLLSAEGTREVAPNQTIIINGQETSDIAALNIGYHSFGNFANIENDDKMAQMYINIQNPNEECIYLGFSVGHINQPSPNPAPLQYRYYIKDPAGNIIYESEIINAGSANIESWEQAYNGPNMGTVQDGYEPVIIDSEMLTSMNWSGAGDYYIQFEFIPNINGQPLLIDFWDITVVNCSTSEPQVHKGRLWAYNWALFSLNDYVSLGRSFEGKFYVCITDALDSRKADISTIDFAEAGFRPGAFAAAFNSFGTKKTDDFTINRKSVWNGNSTIPEYPIFLNYPGDIYTPLDKPEIEFHGLKGFCSDEACLEFMMNRRGIMEILLDFDKGDNLYTENSADRLISYEITEEEVGKRICIPWDRLDGLKDFVVEGTIPIQVKFQYGLAHFPIYDAEIMERGFIVNNLSSELENPLLYYDDSDILADPGNGVDKIMLDGCTMPCHSWTYFVNNDVLGYGNKCTINSWWFSGEIMMYFTEEIIVEDEEAPSLTCPVSEIDVYVDENCAYLIPDFLASLNPSDDCTPTGEILLVQNPAPGESASDAITVLISAEDWAGNIATCEVVINPIDTISPQVMGPDTVQVTLDEDCRFIVPDVIDGREIIENCQLKETYQNPEVGEERDYNSEEDAIIKITAIDASGNISYKDIFMMFTPENPTELDCPTILSIDYGNDGCGAEVTLSDPVVRVNCGSYTLSNDYNGSENVSGFYEIGTTDVSYSLIDDFGNVVKCSFTVTVGDDPLFYIPNTFTPNNDGTNDRLFVYLSNSMSGLKELEIYDRWGNRVYEERYSTPSHDIIGWDGTYKGKPLSPSIFVYKVVLELCDGSVLREQGTFSIIK